MPPIRLGVIGLSAQGWAAAALIPPLFDPLLSSKYTLTALCTSSEASAKTSAAKYTELAGRPVKGYFGETGPTDIANDPEVDMVVISVKIPDHYKVVMPAVEAGKDIFLEWSPGKDLQETIRMAEAAKAKGLRSLVGAQPNQGNTAKKVKELLQTGKVGRVLSTSISFIWPSEMHFAGRTSSWQNAYSLDLRNGATLLTIAGAHNIIMLEYVFSEFTAVSAATTVRIPQVKAVDASGNPTGDVLPKTAHDQVVLTGYLGGQYDGTLVNLLCQAGPPGGRFSWYIDGEDGVIEVRSRPENGIYGAFPSTSEMQILLNDEEVALETKEEDRLGNSGKAWLEFAKGVDGYYETLESSVRVWKVLDAAMKSIEEGGKMVSVV
ncbi:NAD-binding Rossmann fold oxidoreductase [Trametopsis cervina]|nr:NAD-binding Rossmann fold oxidoreductase [Trametopsis cervina]